MCNIKKSLIGLNECIKEMMLILVYKGLLLKVLRNDNNFHWCKKIFKLKYLFF